MDDYICKRLIIHTANGKKEAACACIRRALIRTNLTFINQILHDSLRSPFSRKCDCPKRNIPFFEEYRNIGKFRET